MCKNYMCTKFVEFCNVLYTSFRHALYFLFFILLKLYLNTVYIISITDVVDLRGNLYNMKLV